MILRLSIALLFITVNSYAINVLIAKKALKYEETVSANNLRIVNVQSLKKACIPVKMNEIKSSKYITTHYINKGSIICKRDIKEYKEHGVIFNFGSIQIEKKGKILQDNDKFIRIKNPDGTVEKIYKDGKQR